MFSIQTQRPVINRKMLFSNNKLLVFLIKLWFFFRNKDKSETNVSDRFSKLSYITIFFESNSMEYYEILVAKSITKYFLQYPH